MAHETVRSIWISPFQTAAVACALGLSSLPLSVGAQVRLPGTTPVTQQPTPVRPAVPSTPPLSTQPVFRPALPPLGAPGILPGNGGRPVYGPLMPGYGGGTNGGFNGGSLLNRSGADYNSLFRRGPNGLDGNASLLTPGNPGGREFSPFLQGNLNQAPNITPDTWNNQARHNATRSFPAPLNNNASYNRYKRSEEGIAYQYDSNHRLHHLAGAGWDIYFPYGAAYYPAYYADFANGVTAASPYFYYATFPPYIDMSGVYNEPPQYIYVPYPVYTPDGQYTGDRPEDVDSYYLNRQNQGQPNQEAAPKAPQDAQGNYKIGEATPRKDTLLDGAVSDLNAAWQNGDVQALAKHIRRDSRIAVYLRGKYQYSLQAGDYLDMTRDAFRATKTVSYKLDNVQRKEKDVYTVSGRHTYTDQKGKSHTVLVTYVLEKVDAEYYITQVGTAPEKIEE